MKTKSDVNQFVAREDVGFVLEPAVKALLAHGMTVEQVLATLTESAKRVIRLSLSDAGEKLSVVELDAEADRAAKQVVRDVRGKAA
jgi:uncharacterized membrane protein